MKKEIGRNDPCLCGSGKKYKQCCWSKDRPGAKKKIKAKVISAKQQQTPDLLERTFGSAIREGKEEKAPPVPPPAESKDAK